MSQYVIGIDVGGTNIKLGVVNPRGQVIARSYLSTDSLVSSKTQLIAALADTIKNLVRQAKLRKEQIAGVGIGLPGLIDHRRGIVTFLPNIAGWKNVPLAEILHKHTGYKVCLDNDVKLITLAEWTFGAGRGVSDLICLTLGTGVGSGLILDNKLYRGSHNAAGELGHVPLNEHGAACNCGGLGCLETYVGNRRLLAQAKSLMGRQISIEEMNALAKKRNPQALQFWHNAATHIGNGLVGAVNLLNPSLIIFGGGVSNNHAFLFPTIRKVIQARAMSIQARAVRIVRAKLKDDAGIIGAYVLVNGAHA